MKGSTLMLSGLVASALWAAPVQASEQSTHSHAQSDTTWASISGLIHKVEPGFIMVDYGYGIVTVSTNQLNFSDQAKSELKQDAKVTITGPITDEFLVKNRMHAYSVYMQESNTAVVAAGQQSAHADLMLSAVDSDTDKGQLTLIGTVGDFTDDGFALKLGEKQLGVETDDMDNDPRDNEGFGQLQVGDRIRVKTKIDEDFSSEYEVDAESFIRLHLAD